jgi:putative membrane protein
MTKYTRERNDMLDLFKDSFSTAFKKPLTWAAMVAIPLIVVLFGYLYATTFADPYERLKDIPVAVINLDAGT